MTRRKSTLNLKTKPAPPAAPLSLNVEEKKAKRAAKADATLDWDRIAQEDGKPWQAGGSANVTTGATGGTTTVVRNQTLIKTLLMQATKTQAIVEIEYLETGRQGTVRREVEPGRVMGGFLSAFDRLTEQDMSFNISRIQSARLTGEIFG